MQRRPGSNKLGISGQRISTRKENKMKLWHDDIRQPPDSSWDHWARTNDEARLILNNYDIDEISLDHDMGLGHLPVPQKPDEFKSWEEYQEYLDLCLTAGSDADDGTELAKWMVSRHKVPEKITIHSWNPYGAKRMSEIFADYGRICVVREYEMPQ